MKELQLADVEEGGIAKIPRFQCNICSTPADFAMQPELVNGSRKYNALYTEQLPFYLCKSHEYIYKKMDRSIELKDYFTETIRENW